MNHLFKLKKDGGYILIGNCPVYDNDFGAWYSPDCKNWHPYSYRPKAIDPEEKALSCVCTDKNGDPVFAGDKVSLFSKPFEVVWNERELGFYLKDSYKAQVKLSHLNRNNIELLKDKDNDS